MHFVFIKLQQLMNMLCHFKNSNIKKKRKKTICIRVTHNYLRIDTTQFSRTFAQSYNKSRDLSLK